MMAGLHAKDEFEASPSMELNIAQLATSFGAVAGQGMDQVDNFGSLGSNVVDGLFDGPVVMGRSIPSMLPAAMKELTNEGSEAVLQRTPGVLMVHRFLGKGTFGEVYHCHVEGLGDIAIKVLQRGTDITLKREIELHSKLQHPHIVGLMRIVHGQPPMMFLQYCEGGSIERLIHSKRIDLTALAIKPRVDAMIQVASAIEYLHDQAIVHRDVKSGNVFFTSPVAPSPTELPPVMLGDLGCAKPLDSSMTNAIGTARYMAPEVMETNVYGPPVDIFSCSVLLFELITGQVPFKGMNEANIIAAIMMGKRPSLEEVPKCVNGIILRVIISTCWADAPEERLTAGSLIRSLQGVE